MTTAPGTTAWTDPETDAQGWLTSVETGRKHAIAPVFADPETGGEMSVTVDLPRAAEEFGRNWKNEGSMWDRFASVLPPFDADKAVSLGEGSTPLVRSGRLAGELGLKNLFFKLEGQNPTGSFKDRQMSVALSMGRLWGRKRYATVSSGNVGNALSAYCAKIGAEAHIWVSDDTAESKTRQISVYGGQLYLIEAPRQGTMRHFWHMFAGMRDFCTAHDAVPMVSARPVNPFMVEGTKTVAFEIAATLGQVPDEMFCCVGGGGLLGGVHKGFAELMGLGQTTSMPRMHGGQKADPLYAPIDQVHDEPYVSGDYYLPLDGDWASESIKSTGGTLRQLDGNAILEAQAILATREGIFVEPQGAYAAASLLAAAREGSLDPEATIVCTLTGNGLKDMSAAARFGEVTESRPVLRATGLEDATFCATGAR